MISCCWRCLSSLYFAWIAFISGASCCIRTIDLICLSVSGIIAARTTIVSSTIDQPHGIPAELWKNLMTASKTSISGWKIFAVTSIFRNSRESPAL